MAQVTRSNQAGPFDPGGQKRNTTGPMSTPEYLICLVCETPCYQFEYKNDKLVEVMCMVCGNDDIDQFMSEEDLEEMSAP